MTHRFRQRSKKIAVYEAIPLTQYSWQESISIEDNVSALFDHLHTQLENHPNDLKNISPLFTNSYLAANNAVDNNQKLEQALIRELGYRLAYKTNKKSPSRVDRAALTFIQSACKNKPDLIPEVLITLLSREEDQIYRLNNLISVMESPAAVIKFLLTLYQHTQDNLTKNRIISIIQTPFKLYTNHLPSRSEPGSYFFYEPHLFNRTAPNRYDEKNSHFFEHLTSEDVESVITLIREGILLIPSEEAKALAHRVKSQVIAEILGKTYNSCEPFADYTDEEHLNLLTECAKASSTLRRFSDIPTTKCFWKKNRQTQSSQTLQAAAATQNIVWENTNSNTATTTSSASSSSSSFYSKNDTAATSSRQMTFTPST